MLNFGASQLGAKGGPRPGSACGNNVKIYGLGVRSVPQWNAALSAIISHQNCLLLIERETVDYSTVIVIPLLLCIWSDATCRDMQTLFTTEDWLQSRCSRRNF